MSSVVPLVLEVILQAVATGFATAPVPVRPPTPALATWQCDFAFHDQRWLRAGQRLGGRTWLPLPTETTERPHALPVLVVLHGLNRAGHLHRLVRDGGFDTRALVRSLVEQGRIEPLIVAAPSQTVHATSSRTLWRHFDLAGFLEAVERCLPARVTADRRRVIVAGFSGAGCSEQGGLLHIAARSAVRPQLLAAVDTCMDQDLGRALARTLSAGPEFLAIWQPGWHRDTQAYLRELGFRSCRGGDPDDSCSDPRSGLHWVRSIRRSGPRVFAEVTPDRSNPHSDHLDVMARFLEFALPSRLAPRSATDAPGPARGGDDGR